MGASGHFCHLPRAQKTSTDERDKYGTSVYIIEGNRKRSVGRGYVETMNNFSIPALKSNLQTWGYSPSLIRAGVPIPGSDRKALVGYFEKPLDARSACILVVATNGSTDPSTAARLVADCRILGAPVVLLLVADGLEFWQQRADTPKRIESVQAAAISKFVDDRAATFAPAAIYRAKTRSRFEHEYQLSFVDAGLMPVVETEIGEQLSRLVERTITEMRKGLGRGEISEERGRWIFQSVFWLLAAKILRDKDVAPFNGIEVSDAEAALAAVGAHYHAKAPAATAGSRAKTVLEQAAETMGRFSNLAHVTTESLAYLYENTLISSQTRQELGTHSTPTYLVEYIVAKLAPLIERIDPARRDVFEPACGHAGFLVSAMRLLRSLVPEYSADEQRKYLRAKLHGVEKDAFAVEIANLSLTLADAPNPNGWDVTVGDMFERGCLRERASKSMILLCNPPFERFANVERDAARRTGNTLQFSTKAAEVLGRVLPFLPAGAVFGLVMPQGFLTSRNTRPLRELIATQFEVHEIAVFPDKVFTFSDAESAVLIARKTTGGPAPETMVRYRRIRENDMPRFKNEYFATLDRKIPQADFSAANDWMMLVPDLASIWDSCRDLPRLRLVAAVGKGLTYKGAADLPKRAITFSDVRFPSAVRGFAQFDCPFLHELPPVKWLNLSKDVLEAERSGRPTGIPQILLNYAPVSRGPWRLRALIDPEGHAITSRFIAIRPTASDVSVIFLWALLNSPLGNAFAFCHSGKRDNLVGMIRELPVPRHSPDGAAMVANLAVQYLSIVKSTGIVRGGQWVTEAKAALLKMDAAVLRLYDLPPRAERDLLNLFAGHERSGVPFTFTRYYEEGFRPAIPLSLYISDEYARTTAAALSARFRTAPASVLRALGEDDE